MTRRRRKIGGIARAFAAGMGAFALGSTPAFATVPPAFKNCAAVNKRYAHGIGKLHAHDKTIGTQPVTTFKRSTALYLRAISYNHGLDRDHDGIACEAT